MNQSELSGFVFEQQFDQKRALEWMQENWSKSFMFCGLYATLVFAGDTLFIVLRKQRLIFLHWYHHITVLLYTWFSYKDQVAGGGWFMTMNYTVHALMYTYYTARAAGVRVPRPCAMIITAAQILQMAMGLTVLGLVHHWMHDVHCPSNVDNVVWGSLMYLSYLILFALFFYDAYLKQPSGDKRTKAE
uniref:Elongation of very long chain fatty acids protein n=1 Tax=Nothobranchius kadleci TaxID=1051664 RepID=A0A1A8CIU7_NOTKA